MLKRIKYLTAGESHGKGLLGIIDGLPAGLEIRFGCLPKSSYKKYPIKLPGNK